MSITISVPDALRQSVEAASGGANTVMYDAAGYPCVMVRFGSYNVEDLIAGIGSGQHPAFVVNGVSKLEFWVSKYPCIIHDGKALSLPGKLPDVVSMDAAIAACQAKGTGWHLMTNAERAAIALWCKANALLPSGNGSWGKTYSDAKQYGVRGDGFLPGVASGDGRTYSGSGPDKWIHNRHPNGIVDLAGNLKEWVGGLRLNNGEINILQNNDAADNTKSQATGSTEWKAITGAGSLVTPGTAGTLKYDSVSAGGGGVVGVAQLDDVIDNSNSPSGVTETQFDALAADAGITVPNLLKQLALFPYATGLGNDKMVVANYGERLPVFGGSYNTVYDVGLHTLEFGFYTRANAIGGFRACFIA